MGKGKIPVQLYLPSVTMACDADAANALCVVIDGTALLTFPAVSQWSTRVSLGTMIYSRSTPLLAMIIHREYLLVAKAQWDETTADRVYTIPIEIPLLSRHSSTGISSLKIIHAEWHVRRLTTEEPRSDKRILLVRWRQDKNEINGMPSELK